MRVPIARRGAAARSAAAMPGLCRPGPAVAVRVARTTALALVGARPAAGSPAARARGQVPRAAAAPASSPPLVVLTREVGKNGKLAAALAQRGLATLELPLVSTSPGPDAGALPPALAHPDGWEWVVVTSPEAASVFLAGWRAAGSPPTRVAVVGAGTGRALLEVEPGPLRVEFAPTLANAASLAAELPSMPGGCRRVLYPASAKAGAALEEGLRARGFSVTRLNTYTTLPVAPSALDPTALAAALDAPVIALASPSAAKAWLAAAGVGAPRRAAAGIGSTTATAARAAGFDRVHFPDAPGLAGFVESIVEALAAGEVAAAP